ncbi:MAG: hypothetical protein LBU14_01755 [Candidatus Peribacteria bacterium]|nr:hypothetical protein [Candidatus Peribacteria bacterium]
MLIYLSSTGKENILSVDLAKKYLEQFNYLNLSNVKISLRNSNYCNSLREEYDVDELEEPHCYKVENLVINNKVKLDFILVPSDYNEISNIVID